MRTRNWGKLVADGHGNVSGQSRSSLGGVLTNNTLAGTYVVQGSCSGTMSLTFDGQAESPITFLLTNGGLAAVVAFSTPGQVVVGRAYRQTAQTGSIQCRSASLSGAYGFLLTGVSALSGSTAEYYSDAGNVCFGRWRQSHVAGCRKPGRHYFPTSSDWDILDLKRLYRNTETEQSDRGR